MAIKTQVRVRSINAFVSVMVEEREKSWIPEELFYRWKSMMSLVTTYVPGVTVVLQRLYPKSFETVLVEGPETMGYEQGIVEGLGLGSYVESVSGTLKPMMVTDGTKDPVWMNGPDIARNRRMFYGLPIQWPGEEVYGMIAVVAPEVHMFDANHQQMLAVIKKAIESDLGMLVYKERAEFAMDYDVLTGVFNRRKLDEAILEEFLRFRRAKVPFSLLLMDIKGFRRINEEYGRIIGDEVLGTFSRIIKSNIRKVDSLGRWDGDGFMMVCYNTPTLEAEELSDRLIRIIDQTNFMAMVKLEISIGIGQVDANDKAVEAVIRRTEQDFFQRRRERNNFS